MTKDKTPDDEVHSGERNVFDFFLDDEKKKATDALNNNADTSAVHEKTISAFEAIHQGIAPDRAEFGFLNLDLNVIQFGTKEQPKDFMNLDFDSFTGLGWYLRQFDTILIMPTGEEGLFCIYIWYRTNVREAFDWIYNASIKERHETR